MSKHSGPPSSPAFRNRRWLRRLAITAGIIILLCVAIDVVVSPIVRAKVNERLAAMPDFTGHIDKVAISVWRGRCHVEGFVFQSRQSPDVPLARVKSAILNVAYLPLIRGKLNAAVRVDELDATAVKLEQTPEEKEKKKEEDKNKPPMKVTMARWQQAMQKAFPMELTRLEMNNSRFRFIDRSRNPAAEIAIEQIHLVGTGLSNKPKKEGEFPAEVSAEGITTGHGRMTFHALAEPTAQMPHFQIRFALNDVSLPELNNFLLAYANADVSAGTFDFEAEVAAQNGAYNGYVKPFFKDLNFKTASDEKKNAAQLLAKKAVTAVASVFQNKDEKKVATKAPFSGNFEQNDVDVWTTIVNLMRNAFVQGLREGFEGQTPAKP